MTEIKPPNELVARWVADVENSGKPYSDAYLLRTVAQRAAEWALQQRPHQWPEPITDRRPTEADGDPDGDVLYFSDGTDWCVLGWNSSSAHRGDWPWLHTPSWRPKPSSDRDQALEIIETASPGQQFTAEQLEILRKAVEGVVEAEAVTEVRGPGSVGERVAVDEEVPLWKRMRTARHHASLPDRPCYRYASELRAVAAWLEDQHDAREVFHTAWEAAHRLRNEAEKAEKGDG